MYTYLFELKLFNIQRNYFHSIKFFSNLLDCSIGSFIAIFLNDLKLFSELKEINL